MATELPAPNQNGERNKDPESIAKSSQVDDSEKRSADKVTDTDKPAVATDAITVSQPVTNSLDSSDIAAAPAVDFRYQEQQLLALPAESRVLQLAVLSTEVALARFVRSYPDTDIMIYQRSWQGKLQWILLADGHYSDVSSARQARTMLAEPLRAAGPFIKPVGQVQQEIKALARLRAESELQE